MINPQTAQGAPPHGALIMHFPYALSAKVHLALGVGVRGVHDQRRSPDRGQCGLSSSERRYSP